MRSEVDTGCSSVVHLFHLIFETKSLINLDLTDSARMVGQQASGSCLHFLGAGIQMHTAMTGSPAQFSVSLIQANSHLGRGNLSGEDSPTRLEPRL